MASKGKPTLQGLNRKVGELEGLIKDLTEELELTDNMVFNKDGCILERLEKLENPPHRFPRLRKTLLVLLGYGLVVAVYRYVKGGMYINVD